MYRQPHRLRQPCKGKAGAELLLLGQRAPLHWAHLPRGNIPCKNTTEPQILNLPDKRHHGIIIGGKKKKHEPFPWIAYIRSVQLSGRQQADMYAQRKHSVSGKGWRELWGTAASVHSHGKQGCSQQVHEWPCTDWEHETCPAMQQTSLCCNLVCYWNLHDGLGQRPWNRPVRPPLHWIEAAVIKYTQLELWLNAIHFSPGVPFLYCPAQTTQTGNVKISHKELKHTVASSADCQVQPALTSPVMLAQGHFGLN